MVLPPSPGAYGGAGPFEMGLTWALTILATAIVGLRVWVGFKTLDHPGWDVLWAIITYTVTLVAQVMQTVAAAYGIGNHQWLLTHSDLREGNKWNWLGRIVGIFSATLGKNVVISLLLRIQGGTHGRKCWILHAVWATNAALCIMIVAVLCKRCKPIEYWWDKSLDGTCNAIPSSVTQVLGTFQGAWMAASDGVLAIYPVFIFWDLNMSWQRKAGLCSLMSGGLIAGVCGALKTVQVQTAYASKDISYNVYPLLVTTLVEQWMILILACIPPLRYFFVKAYQKTRATLPNSSLSYSRRPKSRLPGSSGAVPLSSLQKRSETWSDGWKKSQSNVIDLENESEEEILPSKEHRVSGKSYKNRDPGITITQDFDVRYEAESRHKV